MDLPLPFVWDLDLPLFCCFPLEIVRLVGLVCLVGLGRLLGLVERLGLWMTMSVDDFGLGLGLLVDNGFNRADCLLAVQAFFLVLLLGFFYGAT